MGVSLRPYQKEAVDKLSSGKILVGKTGAGKSRTAIAFYEQCYGDLPLLIITTAKKRDSKEWEEELEPFQITAQIDSWNNINKYLSFSGFVIFDEDKVTGDGAWTKGFLTISMKNKWIILSATPGDCYNDYWAVWVANGFFKNKTDFRRKHIVYNNHVTKFPMIDHYINTGLLNKYRRAVIVDMKYEPKTTQNHIDEICHYNKQLYKTVMTNRWNIYKDEPIKNRSELCYLLRKIVNSDESRIIKCYKIFLQRKKLLIFYNFDYELEMLRNMCIINNIVYSELNGHKHDPLPEGDEWIYLVNYASGAEAWNCITCDTMIFYSQTYSYKNTIQAAGRIDRSNTPYKDLYYYHYEAIQIST